MEKRKGKSYEWWLQMILFVISVTTLVCIGLTAFGIPRHSVFIRSQQAVTRHTAFQLKHSITSFFAEYFEFPSDAASSDSENISYTNDNLMSVLIGTEVVKPDAMINPRNIVFFSGRRAGESRKGGVAVHPDGTHELFDPWGNHYRIIMDTNGDDQINAPSWTGLKEPIKRSVIVWSPGPDGKDEAADDNIISW